LDGYPLFAHLFRTFNFKLLNISKLKTKERYYIFCDESVKKGSHYSDFYGGVLVNSKDFDRITKELERTKAEIGFTDEIKWTKTDMLRQPQYEQIMDVFFKYIASGHLKVRIMFTHNRFIATNLTEYQYQHQFQLLYYQFIKYAFGLMYTGETLQKDEINLELFFDELPDKEEKNTLFKTHLWGLQFLPSFSQSNVSFTKRDIQEIDSKNYILLQSLGVVLGAMAFRLNQQHRFIPEGKMERGKRTIAKERLYNHIIKHIKAINPDFNIGLSTGKKNGMTSLWIDEYRHWRFTPRNFEIRE